MMHHALSFSWRRDGCRVLLLLAALLCRPRASQAEELTEVPLVPCKVRAGETPAAIASRLWGDPRLVDLILRHNDLGTPPGPLRAGQVLKVPPDAWLSFVRNRVDIHRPLTRAEQALPRAPEPAALRRPARGKDPLDRGDRVEVLPSSSAEIFFVDDTAIQLREYSMLLIAGADARQIPNLPPASNTTLLHGMLRVQRPRAAAGQARVVIDTPSGQVQLVHGEGLLHVDAMRSTRVSVWSGEISVIAMGRKVRVPAGWRTQVPLGGRPAVPVRLPEAPGWAQPPSMLLLTLDNKADLGVDLIAAPGGGEVALWHVQLSRDERFNDLVLDRELPRAETRLHASGLEPGTYFARAMGIDADHFEGAPGQTTRIEVVRARLLGGDGSAPASVEVPAGLSCALDDGPQMLVTGPIPLAAGRQHTLRCTLPSGGLASEIRIAASSGGPLRHGARLEHVRLDTLLGRGKLLLHLKDARGQTLTRAQVRVRASQGVLIGDVSESAAGLYSAEVAWPREKTEVRLHVSVNEVDEIDVVLPIRLPPAPTPRPAREAATTRIVLGLAGQVAFTDLSQGPFGWGASVEIGLRFAMPYGALYIGLRPSFEDHWYTSGVRVPCHPSPGTPEMLCISSRRGDYADLFARVPFVISLPVLYFLRSPQRTFVPYLGIAPQLVVDFTQASVLGLPNRIVHTEHAGVSAFAGLGVRLPGPLHRSTLFIEAGYRHVDIRERRPNDAGLSCAILSVGYRHDL